MLRIRLSLLDRPDAILYNVCAVLQIRAGRQLSFRLRHKIRFSFGGTAMYVYDFDNTIYNGDSSVDFYLFCLRRDPRILRAAPEQLSAFLRFYTRKKDRRTPEEKTAFKECVYSYFPMVTDIDQTVSEFWDTHIEKIKIWYILQKKPDDLIISASPAFLVEPACRRLGIRRQLSSDVGRASGLYLGLNCHGAEKVRRFREAFGDARVDAFYSDSLSDTPMARLAGRAFLVKGNRRLPWPEDC